MHPKRALVELGGVASAHEIAQLSSRQRFRTSVKQGEIVRIGRSRYCLPHTSNAYAEAQASGAYLSHLSAALHHGWTVRMPPDQTMLISHLPAADRDGWATSPLRTIRDCAIQLPFADGLSVADSALRAGAITHEDLVRASRRWPAHARRVALLADGKAKNPFESSLRAHALDAGLDCAAQWEVTVDGVVMHPDVADPWSGLALEADSWAFHAKEKADHDRDCGRYNLLVMAGWRVLRFTWVQVMFDRDGVIRVLRSTRSAHIESPPRREHGVSAA